MKKKKGQKIAVSFSGERKDNQDRNTAVITG